MQQFSHFSASNCFCPTTSSWAEETMNRMWWTKCMGLREKWRANTTRKWPSYSPKSSITCHSAIWSTTRFSFATAAVSKRTAWRWTRFAKWTETVNRLMRELCAIFYGLFSFWFVINSFIPLKTGPIRRNSQVVRLQNEVLASNSDRMWRNDFALKMGFSTWSGLKKMKKNYYWNFRSHEVKPEGYESHHNGKCWTIFSAPN